MRMNELKPLRLAKKHKQVIARKLREDGIEVSPDGVEIVLKRAYTTIRQKMVEKGYHEFAKMSDDEIRKFMQESR